MNLAPRRALHRLAVAQEGLFSFLRGRVQYVGARRRRREHDEKHRIGRADRRLYGYSEGLLPNPYVAERERGSNDLDSARDRTGLSIGYPAWNLLYYVLLTHLDVRDRPALIVETGTNIGFSTIILAQALKDSGQDGIVHTIEIEPGLVDAARSHVQRAGLADLVRFHTGDSLSILRQLLVDEPHVDFAFLDGCHLFHHVRNEFALLFPKLVVCRGKVYFDNITSPEVSKAIRWIRAVYRGNYVEFMNCSWGACGQGVWQPR